MILKLKPCFVIIIATLSDAGRDCSFDTMGLFHLRGYLAVPLYPRNYDAQIDNERDWLVEKTICYVDLHFRGRSKWGKRAILWRRLQGRYRSSGVAIGREGSEVQYQRILEEARRPVAVLYQEVREESVGSCHMETSTSTPIPMSPQYIPGLPPSTPWDLIVISSDSEDEDPSEGLGGDSE